MQAKWWGGEYPLGVCQSVSDDATDPLLGTTSSPHQCLWLQNVLCSTFLKHSYIFWSLSDNNPQIGGVQSVCVCSPSLLFHAQCLIIGLYTLPPVIPAPTATGIIAHFLLSVCVWPQWQWLLSQHVCVLLALKVSAGSYAWHGSLVLRVMSLSGLSTSNSCCVDLTLTRIWSSSSKKCAQWRRSLQNTLVLLVLLSCHFSIFALTFYCYAHKLLESKESQWTHTHLHTPHIQTHTTPWLWKSFTSPKVGMYAFSKM